MILRLTCIFILFICLSSCYITNCPNKNEFVNGFKEFTSKIEDHPPKEWETDDKEFYQYMNDCYRTYTKELTNEEKAKLWMYALAYYSEKYEGRIDKGFEEAKEKLKPEVLADFESFINTYPEELLKNGMGKGIKIISNILKGVSKEMIPELEKLGKELEKTTNQMSKELEKLESENK